MTFFEGYDSQKFVSNKLPMPVDILTDTSKTSAITGETLQLKYWNSTVLTSDAGQVAGTLVMGKFSYSGLLDSGGVSIGTDGDTSIAFTTGTVLTTEKKYPYELVHKYKGLEALATAVTTGFANGEYCVDYRNGVIYGLKATTGTSDTVAYIVATQETSTSGGGSTTSTTLTGGEKTVTTSGTGEALGAVLTTKSIYIRAKSTNTNDIFVGDSGVDATTSKQVILSANDSVTLDISDRSTVYVDVTTNGEGVDYLCMS